MLSYIENFIVSQDDLKDLEDKLSDYSTVKELVDMVEMVFDDIIRRVEKGLQK